MSEDMIQKMDNMIEGGLNERDQMLYEIDMLKDQLDAMKTTYNQIFDEYVKLESKHNSIGWRLCKDELPEKPNIAYVVLNKHNCIELCCIDESGNWWNAETTADFPDVVQWCKLPEPLKEGE